MIQQVILDDLQTQNTWVQFHELHQSRLIPLDPILIGGDLAGAAIHCRTNLAAS